MFQSAMNLNDSASAVKSTGLAASPLVSAEARVDEEMDEGLPAAEGGDGEEEESGGAVAGGGAKKSLKGSSRVLLTNPRDILGVSVFERLFREIVNVLSEHAENNLCDAFPSADARTAPLSAAPTRRIIAPSLVNSAFSVLKVIAEGDCNAVLWAFFFKVMIVRCGLRAALAAQIALAR